MRLNYISVQNFRCIEDCSLNIREFTSFIGQNNSGKSTLLRAIEVFLNQTKPKPEEWRKGYEALPIIIEGHFDDIQEWEKDRPGVASLVNNNQIRLRMKASREKGSITTDYEAYVSDEAIDDWADKWKELNPKIQEIAKKLEINGTTWRTKANQERVRQEVRDKHPELIIFGEEHWTSEGISITPALKQAIPQAVIVPAVKDATDETKTTQKTSFGLLLNTIIIPAIEKSDEYQNFLSSVETLSSRISGKKGSLTENGKPLTLVQEVAEEISQRMSSIVETQAIISLDKPDVNKFLGSNATIALDDGTETPIYLQGHGVQRSLVFALIEYLAKQDAVMERTENKLRQRATVLLFEEPELYMHPHLMRRLRNALEGIAERSDWQVIISTHSPFLIDVANDPKSLVIFRRSSPKEAIEMVQLSDDPFKEDNPSHKEDREALRAALNFHPTVNEAFFAQRVVLVEGDTEVAVLCHSQHLLTLAGINSSSSDNTSIVSCSGKWTILPIAKLLSQFGIPFRIIHDCDRKGKTDEELKEIRPIHPYRANERIKQVANGAEIFVVEDTFEHILWEPNKAPLSDKPYRAWCKINDVCDGRENLDHVPRLKEFVRFAFEW
ncbi:MAG: ATP-dependent endonuclease [Candidatus Parabeggiatoa sp.]|nr:ATP-dependent endonuclease [Candidatus Parabeggiatoa sp.]